MLPVSGAEQLNTSGAQITRPMISANGAYSRLVRPGPSNTKVSSTCSAPCHGGMNRFHNPCARAFTFSSSTIWGTGQRAPTSCSLYSCWRGRTCWSMNPCTRVISSRVLEECSKFMCDLFLSGSANPGRIIRQPAAGRLESVQRQMPFNDVELLVNIVPVERFPAVQLPDLPGGGRFADNQGTALVSLCIEHCSGKSRIPVIFQCECAMLSAALLAHGHPVRRMVETDHCIQRHGIHVMICVSSDRSVYLLPDAMESQESLKRVQVCVD